MKFDKLCSIVITEKDEGKLFELSSLGVEKFIAALNSSKPNETSEKTKNTLQKIAYSRQFNLPILAEPKTIIRLLLKFQDTLQGATTRSDMEQWIAGLIRTTLLDSPTASAKKNARIAIEIFKIWKDAGVVQIVGKHKEDPEAAIGADETEEYMGRGAQSHIPQVDDTEKFSVGMEY